VNQFYFVLPIANLRRIANSKTSVLRQISNEFQEIFRITLSTRQLRRVHYVFDMYTTLDTIY